MSYNLNTNCNLDWKPGEVLFKSQHFLEASEQYLINNCHAFGSKIGNDITNEIFEKYPYSNIYTERLNSKLLNIDEMRKAYKDRGKIMIRGDGATQRFVINIFCQIFPDAPFFMPKDQYNYYRLRYFTACLNKVYKINNIQSVAFPEKTGCYYFSVLLWKYYKEIISKFAYKFPHVKTVVYTGDIARKLKDPTQRL